MWAAARDSWKSLRAFPLSSRLAPHFSLLLLKLSLLFFKFPLLFFKLPVIFFSEGSGVWAGKGGKRPRMGGGAAGKGELFAMEWGKKFPRGAGKQAGGAALGKGVRQKNPRGAGKQAEEAALGKGVRQKKSPRGGDVELFGGVVYNLYPREMSPARFLAPSSENLSTPKSASMPRVNPEGNWYPTMACMPASKRFTPLRLKVFSS